MKRLNVVINPLRGGYSWYYEQQIYATNGVARALKSGEGTGNLPKAVIVYETQ